MTGFWKISLNAAKQFFSSIHGSSLTGRFFFFFFFSPKKKNFYGRVDKNKLALLSSRTHAMRVETLAGWTRVRSIATKSIGGLFTSSERKKTS